MATMLNHKNVYVVPPLPLPQIQPSIDIPFTKPVSYDFRVVEWMKDSKVSKVTLQVQIWEHDKYGNGVVVDPWRDVERIQLPISLLESLK